MTHPSRVLTGKRIFTRVLRDLMSESHLADPIGGPVGGTGDHLDAPLNGLAIDYG